jgi:hypothetical protein
MPKGYRTEVSTLVAARSGGDDFVRIGGPDEGLWLLVMIDGEAVDGGLEIDDALGGSRISNPLH